MSLLKLSGGERVDCSVHCESIMKELCVCDLVFFQSYTNVQNYLPEDLLALGTKPKKGNIPGLSPLPPPQKSKVVLHASNDEPRTTQSDLETSPENSEVGDQEEDAEKDLEDEEAMDAEVSFKLPESTEKSTRKRGTAATTTAGKKTNGAKSCDSAGSPSKQTMTGARKVGRPPKRKQEEEVEESVEEEEQEEEEER